MCPPPDSRFRGGFQRDVSFTEDYKIFIRKGDCKTPPQQLWYLTQDIFYLNLEIDGGISQM